MISFNLTEHLVYSECQVLLLRYWPLPGWYQLMAFPGIMCCLTGNGNSGLLLWLVSIKPLMAAVQLGPHICVQASLNSIYIKDEVEQISKYTITEIMRNIL